MKCAICGGPGYIPLNGGIYCEACCPDPGDGGVFDDEALDLALMAFDDEAEDAPDDLWPLDDGDPWDDELWEGL